MKKKIYMKPQMKAVEIRMQGMLIVSGKMGGTPTRPAKGNVRSAFEEIRENDGMEETIDLW